MSVDLSILVRNDFSKTDDPQACREYILQTIAHLKRYFCAEDIIEDLHLEEDEMSFYLKPLDNICVHLHKGCWELETCYHYSEYFYNDEENSNFLRRFAYDCARALGKEEAWITDEYHGWFGLLSNVSDSFEDWLKSKSNVKGFPDQTLEYVPDSFSDEDLNKFNYSTKYHDSFDGEPKNRLVQLSALFPEYEILTTRSYANIILGKKDGKLYAIDIAKRKLFVDFPIDGINTHFQPDSIKISKDDKSALFNPEGEQLTPFGNFEFQWKWSGKKKRIRSMSVTDKGTGESFTLPL